VSGLSADGVPAALWSSGAAASAHGGLVDGVVSCSWTPAISGNCVMRLSIGEQWTSFRVLRVVLIYSQGINSHPANEFCRLIRYLHSPSKTPGPVRP
jgi:hypothetical protein